MQTQALNDKTKGIGFAVRKKDLEKIEAIREFFNAKNNSEAVRIAIDLAYTLTRGGFYYELETK